MISATRCYTAAVHDVNRGCLSSIFTLPQEKKHKKTKALRLSHTPPSGRQTRDTNAQNSPVISTHRRQYHPSHRALVYLLRIAQRVEQVVIGEYPSRAPISRHRTGLRDGIILPRPRRSRAVSLLPVIQRPYSHAHLYVVLGLRTLARTAAGGGLWVRLDHGRLQCAAAT